MSKQRNSKNIIIFSKTAFQKVESRYLKAENEAWPLMNEDYPGKGKGKANHNPPINNR